MGWHIIVTEEMRALGLSGNDLMVYALINGFSQKGQGCFYGSLSYICETCGISRRTAIYILSGLVDKGLIQKTEIIVNGVKRVHYQVCMGSAEIAPEVVQNLHKGSAKIALNNIIDNNTPTEYINNKSSRYDFKKALVEIGVSEQIAKDWMEVRKAKGAANTETSFKSIEREIIKSGLPANECIRVAVENSWRGFKAEWIMNQQRASARTSGKVSVLENNKAVAEELMRISMNMEEST